MPLQEVQAGDARALKDIADTIAKSHKVLVVTGAGISTSCGVPDFRSKDGLYNMIPEQYLPTPPSSQASTPSRKRKASLVGQTETPSRNRRAIEIEDDDEDEISPSSQISTFSRVHRRNTNSPASKMRGQDLFHARVFQRAETTQVFNQFIAGFKQKLRDEVKQTSKTHKFIRALRDGGRLMRCYTQNIDGLEQREGLCVDLARGKGSKRRFMKKNYEMPRPDKITGTDFDGGCEVVQLHGELTKLRCTVCSTEEEWTEEASQILLEGAAPECNTCSEKSELRQATGKRGLAIGTLRPNIVLYGEEHPHNVLLSPLVPYDIASNPEVLIIMGTSLKVFGMQKIIKDFAKAIHSKGKGRVIFVNRTRPSESVWDGIIDDFVQMDCDEWVEDLKTRRAGLWLHQGELDLKETRSEPNKKRKSDSIDRGYSGEEVLNTDDEAALQITKRINIRHNPHISVNIPKRILSAEEKMSRSQSATPSSHGPSKRATHWKNGSPSKDLQSILSPLARAQRPIASPLHESTIAAPQMETANLLSPASPPPPPFSPITPQTTSRFRNTNSRTPSRLRVHQEIEVIVIDDDTDEEAETKEATLGPEHSLNSKLVATHTAGEVKYSKTSLTAKLAKASPVKKGLFGRLVEKLVNEHN